MNSWLKRHGGFVLKAALTLAVLALCVLAGIVFWKDHQFRKSLETTPEPELCALCGAGDGIQYHAPALLNLSTGKTWELEIYDSVPTRPWEVTAEQRWDDWIFRPLDGNAVMSKSSEDHTNIATITETHGKIDPAHFCHDCRALLAETASEGYVLLDMYDLENIQAFVIEDGAEYTIRDYTVSISKDKELNGLSVEVTGHLFGAE